MLVRPNNERNRVPFDCGLFYHNSLEYCGVAYVRISGCKLRIGSAILIRTVPAKERISCKFRSVLVIVGIRALLDGGFFGGYGTVNGAGDDPLHGNVLIVFLGNLKIELFGYGFLIVGKLNTERVGSACKSVKVR